MSMEQILVAAIVCGALFFVVRALGRAWKGKSRCGCGSGSCPAAREAADRIVRSIARAETGKRESAERENRTRERRTGPGRERANN
ncbi:MAG: hypothetical protein ABIH26_09935 [Candidatus Eisenbacteria bacterium]